MDCSKAMGIGRFEVEVRAAVAMNDGVSHSKVNAVWPRSSQAATTVIFRQTKPLSAACDGGERTFHMEPGVSLHSYKQSACV